MTLEERKKNMSIKKEMLRKLSEEKLKELAEDKGIKFDLTEAQKKYYDGWEEKEKIVDLMTGKEDLSVNDIERYIKKHGGSF